LLKQPETGMGYQILKKKGSYEKEMYIAYNADVIIKIDDNLAENKTSLKNMSLLKENLETIPYFKFKVLSKSELQQNINFVNEAMQEGIRMSKSENEVCKSRYDRSIGAKDNQKENASGSERFVRLSPYKNDIRIDYKKKCLKKKAFTTTENNYNCLRENRLDPIDRYALPSNFEIKWVFYIQPQTNDSLQRGTVQPANGKKGGGEEAFFKKGTSKNTLIEKKEY